MDGLAVCGECWWFTILGLHIHMETWFSNTINYSLVVSTPLKNISQIGNLPQVGVNIRNIWNHQPDHQLPPTSHNAISKEFIGPQKNNMSPCKRDHFSKRTFHLFHLAAVNFQGDMAVFRRVNCVILQSTPCGLLSFLQLPKRYKSSINESWSMTVEHVSLASCIEKCCLQDLGMKKTSLCEKYMSLVFKCI